MTRLPIAAYLLSLTALHGLIPSRAAAQSFNPVPSSFFGVISTDVNDYPMVSFGAVDVRQTWPVIETSQGVYDFAFIDHYVNDARRHGLFDASTNTVDALLTFGLTPRWYAADPKSCLTPTATVGPASYVQCTSPPANIQDWINFVGAVMNHYNGVTQPHIRYYELWNEANLPAFWTGSSSDLVNLAKAAYPIVHADPYSMLLTPSVSGSVGPPSGPAASTWMAGYLDAGGSQYADGGSFHGYLALPGVTPYPMPEQDSTPGCSGSTVTNCYGSVVTKTNVMRQMFDSHGLKGKPMYNSEGSWARTTDVTDPDTQTAWLARYYLLQAGLRATDNLQMAAWYAWGGVNVAQTWGVIEAPALIPTPAGTAYGQIYRWVTGATIAQPCIGAADGTWTCTLTRPGGYSALAAWNTNGPTTYTPAAGYTNYRDLAGNTTPMPTSGSVSLGPKPILLESVTGPAPVITLAANAEGERVLAAPNTWIEIKGFNLAPPGHARTWQDSDFAGGTMPVQLDGVSVTINGKSAYVFYISQGQVNILTPPDALAGQVPVVVNNNGAASAAFMVPAQNLSPSFFAINGGPYVVAQHGADSGLVGPPNLYPGVTTPAKPGETVVLYANGFGPVSQGVVSGSPSQSGTLNGRPTITIGGIAASVTYAGINGLPGLFQFNVVVPPAVPDGDNLLSASWGAVTTAPATWISVHH